LLLAVTLTASLLWAQGEAAISGVATDATGSTMRGATIRITNTEKGTVRTILTDGAGRYEAPLLAVGTYEVSAAKAGFNTSKQSVALVLGQHANVDLTLSVAGIQQAVRKFPTSKGMNSADRWAGRSSGTRHSFSRTMRATVKFSA
jgi:uncharacterized protein YdgA (DUF945 family)